MNFPVALFALLAARQANDSPADAGRIALVAKGAKRPSPLLVRVVHVRTLPKRQWLHGCVFGGTLSGEEIQVLR